MKRRAIKSMTVVLVCAVLVGSSPPTAQAAEPSCSIQVTDPIPVAVRVSGGDSLMQRLADAVRSAYGGCGSGYAAVGREDSGVVEVTMLQVLRSGKVGPRMHVRYRAAFKVYGEPRSQASGTCWEDNLSDCARAIVRATPAVNME